MFRRDKRVGFGVAQLAAPTGFGIEAVVAEVAPLYKAKAPNAHAQRDFEVLQPVRSAARRGWLKGALETCYPGHPWAVRLEAAPTSRRRQAPC